MTPWHQAWDRAKSDPRFIDLIDSRFHQNGLLPDRQPLEAAFAAWLGQRAYQPDSRGAEPARQTLAEFYRQQGWAAEAADFFLTAGTSEAYGLIFSVFAAAGDHVALPSPGYPLFEQLAHHARLETVTYHQPFAQDWQPDLASLRAAVTPRTRFVVLISPNNPTGQIITPEQLREICAFCRERDLILIFDEVFDAFVFDARPLPRPPVLDPQVRCFTLNGISKRFGSPDLKLAWIGVSGPAAWKAKAESALDLANDTFLSANSLSQFLLPTLFATSADWQQRAQRLLESNRKTVATWLNQTPRVTGKLAQGGIHGLWRVSGCPMGWDDERLAVELLDQAHLALHPGFFYDLQEPGIWLVYSLLKPPAEFQNGLERLARFLG